MSTKIYNAYKVNDIKTVFTIKEHLMSLYASNVLNRLDEIKDLKFGENTHVTFFQTNPHIESLLDKYKDTLYKDVPSVHLKYLIDWEVQINAAGSLLSVGASMIMYYYATDIYIQFFGIDHFWKEAQNYIARLEKKGVIKEFYFQNQTDDRFDDKEYMKRSKIWDKILKNDAPINAGFSYNFWNEGDRILSSWKMKLRDGKLPEGFLDT
jgi:hypothetical protein